MTVCNAPSDAQLLLTETLNPVHSAAAVPALHPGPPQLPRPVLCAHGGARDAGPAGAGGTPALYLELCAISYTLLLTQVGGSPLPRTYVMPLCTRVEVRKSRCIL